MKKFLIVLLALMTPAIAFAHKLLPTTFSMSCFIISQDDKWSYRDYGFKLTYKDKHGKKQTVSAESKGTKKSCTNKFVSVNAEIPASKVKFQITDFTGEMGSTIECTNTINYKLTKDQIGKTCEFMVKTPKYGSYTSTDECALKMACKDAEKKDSANKEAVIKEIVKKKP
jgi:hypothetical protein